MRQSIVPLTTLRDAFQALRVAHAPWMAGLIAERIFIGGVLALIAIRRGDVVLVVIMTVDKKIVISNIRCMTTRGVFSRHDFLIAVQNLATRS